MVGTKTDFLEQFILEKIFDPADAGSPLFTNLFIALATVGPDDTTTGTTIVEPVWAAYLRINKVPGSTNWQHPTGPVNDKIENKVNFLFAANDGGVSVNLLGAGIVDALTLGNLLFAETFGSVVPIAVGETPRISAGTLTITET